MDVCELGKTDVILGIPWSVAYNPEIDWEKGEVRMMRCPPLCGKAVRIKGRKEIKEDKKKLYDGLWMKKKTGEERKR